MARSCEICGKGFSMGNSVTIRGKQKYLGGVGTKITGITRRKFKPNLQRLKVTLASGATATNEQKNYNSVTNFGFSFTI
ncbi:MAG: 50S ribosomal protein L28 [Planctomycetia bacterium]|nr:50S ribosomal protein L28 [Planctomycetia bacterium]